VGAVARCLNTQHVRGMGRYVFDLIDQARYTDEIDWLLFGDDPDRPMSAPQGLRGRSEVFSFRGDRFQLWEQIGLPRKARQLRVDVLHCTEGTLPWWQPVPTVITLHDTLAWMENDGTPWSRFFWGRLMPAALARSAAVITISECSRRDILRFWPALEHKLTVIPHGISPIYFDSGAAPARSDIQNQLGDAPYMVYMGGPLARKRFGWALQVLAGIDDPRVHLVVCGFGESARAGGTAQVPPALRERVRFAPFLSDEQLLALYRGAFVALYPTLYEGFGFPAVETQVAGTPVVFSAVSSLAELVGPLALVREPDDLPGWLEAVRHARNLGQRRVELAHAARDWALRFSWEQSFAAHRAVYEQAAGRGGRQ
jgi:alpha-1,3-rhamnosyl/mannosyltransferase